MTFYVAVSVKIRDERVDDLFIDAFDTGAINHWCDRVRFVSPAGKTAGFSTGAENFSVVRRLQEAGWALRFFQSDESPRDVLLFDVGRALSLMAEKYPDTHWKNFMDENDDAETADVFCQLCCFGEIVYG